KGGQQNASLTLFAPGLMPNNSIRLFAGYERQDVNNDITLVSRMSAPRGFATIGLIALHTADYSASYALPLWYPDIALGGFAYIKRLRVNLFWDCRTMYTGEPVATVNGNEVMADFFDKLGSPQASFRGMGYEAVVDFHAFRFPLVMLSVGWRQSFTQHALPQGNSYVPATLPWELRMSFSY
ncbi:MAG: hypothetical protein LBS94_04810, partial [Prevotellaceae bacterium]|nr:hypothetical protein [Prevotellaceae bacterium]